LEVCTLASSSSGNAALLSHGGTHILIDAGISLRRITRLLAALGISPEMLSGVLITHNHSDHISGLGMLIKHYRTPVFASDGAGRALCAALPETRDGICFFEPGEQFNLGELTINGFPTPHDAPGSVGYRVTGGGKSIAFATDLGLVTREVARSCEGADLAIIEANHDVDLLKSGAYPRYLKERILSDHGHLSNRASAHFAVSLAQSGAKRIVLAHLSRENNTAQLAYDAVRAALDREKADTALHVAPQYDLGAMYTV
jgi:phosphoribosyl 1,2-cyclic phosphodiesterase